MACEDQWRGCAGWVTWRRARGRRAAHCDWSVQRRAGPPLARLPAGVPRGPPRVHPALHPRFPAVLQARPPWGQALQGGGGRQGGGARPAEERFPCTGPSGGAATPLIVEPRWVEGLQAAHGLRAAGGRDLGLPSCTANTAWAQRDAWSVLQYFTERGAGAPGHPHPSLVLNSP